MSEAHHDYRGYAGQVAGGVLRAGDEVVVLPSGRRSRIAAIDSYDGELEEAFPPMSVTLRLEDDIDVSRGDMICRPHNRPEVTRGVEATVCWMSDAPLRVGGRYALKHTTRTTRAIVEDIRFRIDVDIARARRGSRGARASTTSAASTCARARRSASTPTARTASPARSSSSTRRPTTPSAPAW